MPFKQPTYHLGKDDGVLYEDGVPSDQAFQESTERVSIMVNMIQRRHPNKFRIGATPFAPEYRGNTSMQKFILKAVLPENARISNNLDLIKRGMETDIEWLIVLEGN